MLSGIPIPLPFLAVSFTRSRLASQVSGRSPSLATQADGVGRLLGYFCVGMPISKQILSVTLSP